MSEQMCARRWEVEAERDGRLRGTDRQSALRHRAHCPACAEEARALSELGQRLRALPTTDRDALAQRRTRQRLLSRWNAELVRGPTPKNRQRATLTLGVAAVFVAAAWLALNLRSSGHETKPAPPTSLLTIQGAPGARWLEQLSAVTDRVELSEGSVSFSVRAHGLRRVIIALPDGELEDLGTVFEVEVRAGHTERIAVRAGRVLVRLAGRAPFELGAGQSWAAAAVALPSASVPAPADSPPLPSASAKTSAASGHRQTAASSGKPPRDPSAASSAEDDAYLHIVDLLRSGHSAQAKAQAKRYLARFPNGFRRPEVERVLAP